MKNQKKNDEKLAKLAFIVVSVELVKTIIELIVKLIDLVGGD
ncbi:MAG: hypothetical protein Q4E28_04860 [Clostridia bacterium]|nr:hypothetical protein [Clostridia bacterium]